MYAQAAIKPNTLLRNGAYGIVMMGVQKCTRGCASLRGRNSAPLCCIKLDTATDDGYTGTNFERPGFQTMMREMEKGEVSCIIVKDLSRLGRDYIEVGRLLDQVFPSRGVRLIAINDRYDSKQLDSATSGLDVAFKNLVYMLYSKDLSQKVTSAMHTRVRKGEYISCQTKYGYKMAADDRHRIVVDPEPAGVVRKIFEMAADGKRISEIMRYLNDNGIASPSMYKMQCGSRAKYQNEGKTNVWRCSSVRKILDDEIYLGKTIWNRTRKSIATGHKSVNVPREEWIVVEGTHEPVITQELFDAAQANRRKIAASSRPYTEPCVLFTCGICGRAIMGYGRRERTFYCGNKVESSHSKCGAITGDMDILEETVLKTVHKLANIFYEGGQGKPGAKHDIQRLQNELSGMERKIKKLSTQKLELYAGYKDGRYSREEYKAKAKEMADRIEAERAEADMLVGLIETERTREEVEQNGSIQDVLSLKEFDKSVLLCAIRTIKVYGSEEIEIVWSADCPFEDEA